jgi:hypothetical protein
MKLKRLLPLLFVCLGLIPMISAQSTPLVIELDPKYATDWMELLYRRVQFEKASPTVSSRIYGYAGVSLYESLLGGMPDNVTLAGQIWHMPDLPLWESETDYDWISVMDATMTTVLPTLFLAPSEETIKAFEDLRDAHTAERIEATSRAIVERSLNYGEELGKELAAWAADDGFADVHAEGLEYTLPEGDGMYVLTTEGTKPNEPFWGEMRPFVLEAGYTCNVPVDVTYSTDTNSVFYKQAVEVMDAGNNLTDWQKETVRYWIDTPGITGAPAGHWISISSQLVDQLDLTLDRTAMMYAMVGMSLADAFISGWWTKYQTMVVRPVTYIQENIRRRWTPYVETPPFPEYVSGHSIGSASAAEVLTAFFGAQAFEDQTHIIYGHEETFARSYTSFEAAAAEAATSRLWGGIHYRSAIENGMRQGRCVGDTINRAIRLNPVLQGE